MQSANMIPPDPIGDPWPAEMTITVQNDSVGLLDLLWVREAWQLSPDGDVPPKLEVAPTARRSTDRASQWQREWSILWRACLAHAAQDPDPLAFQRLRQTGEGSSERERLLQAFAGPSPREFFGMAAFDDSYTEWMKVWLDNVSKRNAVPLASTPERRVLVALIPAWEAGLRRVITIPCSGEYTRLISPSALVVTDRTRDDPRLYAEALSEFVEKDPRSI